ncbi:hypothetical protein [Pseudolysinimonas sp.]|uniref:hypothetical protein n=1 Tax=Pseudolysinimonas sp. TaxID=2680009 RepID=UPI003F8074EB
MSSYISNRDIINAWAARAHGGDREFTRSQEDKARVGIAGDRILSYGWWEMARIVRDRHGSALFYLVNGDNYGTVTTSKHQSMVRQAVSDNGIPVLIIPFTVLDEAGIQRDTIRPLDITPDTYTTTVVTAPADDPSIRESTDYWGNTVYRSGPGGRTTWDRLEDGSFERTVYRHWLGESLIQAAIRYSTTVRCTRCKGAGVFGDDTRGVALPTFGPELDYGHDDWYRHRVGHHETYPVPSCQQCGGRGRTAVTRTRTAKFLSGFDRGETRPSYFFCELPRMSETTVTAAYDALKPTTVLMAERMGRDISRQGDIFAVPMPTLNLSRLRHDGATISKGEHILGTNHKATEVAIIRSGRKTLTYARGTLTHDPAGRRPDHKRVTMGDRKTWHLVVKNTVPVSA